MILSLIISFKIITNFNPPKHFVSQQITHQQKQYQNGKRKNGVGAYRFIKPYLTQQKYMIELTLQHNHHHDGTQHKHEDDDSSSDQNDSLKQLPCHPHRRAASFDFSAIQQQIKIIRRKKQEAKELARLAKKVEKTKHELYEADIIQEELEQSLDLVPGFISLALKQRIKFIQDKVYISAQNQNFGELVSRIKQEAISNEALGNELNLMMSQIQVALQNDIDEGVYDIHPVEHKKKVIPIEPEPAHRVKLKNMLIKNKIMDLKEEFNRSQILSENLATTSVDGSRVGSNSKINIQRFVNRNQNQIWGDEFHLLSEGTKKAQEFVKKIQEEQKKIRLQKSKKQREMKSLQVKSAMQHKQFEEQMRRQKHQSLKKRYEEGRLQKMTEKEKQEQRQREYINFLKQYRGKKPLFKKKEEEFQSQVIEQQERRRKAQLEEIRKLKRPITLEQLEEHQRNYQKIKEQKEAQHNEQRNLRKKQVQNLPKRSYYRGKFHSLVLEQQQQAKNVVDPQVARDALLKKQKQFGEIVRQKYSPMISQAKRKELEEMIKVINSQKARKGLTEQQYKELGNNYLKQLKAMMAELKAKGLVKQSTPLPEVPKKKNYLQEVREKYNFSTIDYTAQVHNNEQWVASKAYKLQKDAKHREKILRFKSQQQFDFEYYMKELSQIHDNYINSAQAKISLINKLQGRKQQRSQKQISDQKSSIS